MNRTQPEEPPWEVHKTFLEHLLELRSRILVCLGAMAVATLAAWIFWKRIGAIIVAPLHAYNASVGEEAKVELITVGPMEAFLVVLKLGVWTGLVLSLPVIVWEVWRFVSPGLYRHERRALIPVMVLGTFFFAGGAYFAYRLILPIGLRYLIPFASEMGARPKLGLNLYWQFFVMIHLAFGIAFEAPLVILALAHLGVVTIRDLARQWRYAIVGAFVVGAVLTPPDVLTQVLMAGSLIGLYFLSMLLIVLTGAWRKAAPEESTEELQESIPSAPSGTDGDMSARSEELGG